jgi:hypothetical protein
VAGIEGGSGRGGRCQGHGSRWRVSGGEVSGAWQQVEGQALIGGLWQGWGHGSRACFRQRHASASLHQSSAISAKERRAPEYSTPSMSVTKA